MPKFFLFHINATNPLILYKHFLFLSLDLNAGSRNIPGSKFNPNGYIIDKAKLTKVSFIIII